MKNHDKLDSHGSKTSFSTRLRWFLLGMAGTAVCWFFWWPIYFTFSGGRYIGSKPPGESYTATQFEFRYGNATRVVKDPYNKMQWVFGQLPDSIEVDKTGMRLIVYNSHNAIVKSSTQKELFDRRPEPQRSRDNKTMNPICIGIGCIVLHVYCDRFIAVVRG